MLKLYIHRVKRGSRGDRGGGVCPGPSTIILLEYWNIRVGSMTIRLLNSYRGNFFKCLNITPMG